MEETYNITFDSPEKINGACLQLLIELVATQRQLLNFTVDRLSVIEGKPYSELMSEVQQEIMVKKREVLAEIVNKFSD
ncbi:MAG: hypothetical protein HYS24_15065 [Ignavibacteriales bacterium]|nr:hypothetical protein [Ignavibacteriales bacterium]